MHTGTMKKSFPFLCVLPWLSMAMSYAMSKIMGLPGNELVYITAVIWSILCPLFMFSIGTAAFEAGTRKANPVMLERKVE